MKKLSIALTIFSALVSLHSHATEFGNAELGRVKAPSCVFCHGATGEAVNASYPNLKNQNAQYLYQSMQDYQQGNRTGALAEMMQAQLSKLNDQDLRDIAAYYSSQE